MIQWFLLQVFTVVNKHYVMLIRITCGLGSSDSEEFTVCNFRNFTEDGDILFPQNCILNKLFCVYVEGDNTYDFWIEMKSLN